MSKRNLIISTELSRVRADETLASTNWQPSQGHIPRDRVVLRHWRGGRAGMHGDDPCAFRRSDSVCEHVFHAATQHGSNVATSPPNPANTPPSLVFPDLKARSGIVRQQLNLLQLLQIVTASRSGCVTLTYRILAQVWHKERAYRSSVHRNERTVSALYATNEQHARLGRRSREGRVETQEVPGSRQAATGPVARKLQDLVRAQQSGPHNLGIATGTNLGYCLS